MPSNSAPAPVDSSPTAPLLLHVPLTNEQRESILAQTGLEIGAFAYPSRARRLRCHFGGLILHVPRGVFVPTASTESAVTAAREVAATRDAPVIVDVGTGSGAVALSLARGLPGASVYATEISELAVKCARRNRTRLQVRNARILRGSLLDPLPRRLRGRVTVIVGNIPYVPPDTTQFGDRLFPAGTAIGSGADGLDLIRDLARSARDFLQPGGALVLQLAEHQWPAFAPELEALGYARPSASGARPRQPIVGVAAWPGGPPATRISAADL
jgi:methylase of polypeptide subunit release factors